jgi:hypothetical protein
MTDPTKPATPAPTLETVSTSNFAFPSGQQARKRSKVSVTMQPQAAVPPMPAAPSQPTSHPQQDPTPPPTGASLLKTVEALLVSTPINTAESNASYYPLELPSHFVFYPFKALSATSIKGKHQAKFSSAAKRKDTRLTVEAITSLLGDRVSAADLTVPDFFYVMYWLRLNGASNAPMKIRAPCSHPDHVLAVAEGRKSVDTLYTVDIINSTKLDQSELEASKVQEFLERPDVQLLRDSGYNLTAPRMQDSIELEEKWVDKPEYDEVEFLAELAGSISALDGTILSLEDRIKAVGEFELPLLALLKDWQEIVQSYGVEESVSLKCKECGANIETEISISASDFL